MVVWFRNSRFQSRVKQFTLSHDGGITQPASGGRVWLCPALQVELQNGVDSANEVDDRDVSAHDEHFKPVRDAELVKAALQAIFVIRPQQLAKWLSIPHFSYFQADYPAPAIASSRVTHTPLVFCVLLSRILS